MLTYACASTSKYNESRFARAKLAAGRSEPNSEKHKKFYWDAQVRLNQSGAIIVYALADYIDAHAPTCGRARSGWRTRNQWRRLDRACLAQGLSGRFRINAEYSNPPRYRFGAGVFFARAGYGCPGARDVARRSAIARDNLP